MPCPLLSHCEYPGSDLGREEGNSGPGGLQTCSVNRETNRKDPLFWQENNGDFFFQVRLVWGPWASGGGKAAQRGLRYLQELGWGQEPGAQGGAAQLLKEKGVARADFCSSGRSARASETLAVD